jgi:acylphosphatase
MSTAPGEPKRLRAIVRGRVQGVGFRASAQIEADRLGLAGWVRNRFDGDVEVEAEGDEEIVRQFLAFLEQGPPLARVRSVDVQWLAPAGLRRPFQVRTTTA